MTALHRVIGDFTDQTHEGLCGPFDLVLAVRRVGRSRIAGHPGRMKVLSLPPIAYAAFRTQHPARLFEGYRARLEVLGEVHSDEVGMEMQHHARLRRAAVDAVTPLVRRIKIGRIDRPEPRRADREHAEFHPQLAADDLHHLGLATMRVPEHDLAHAGPPGTLGDLEPHAGQHVVREAQRAGKGQMLVRLADRQSRQDQGRQIVRHQGDGARHDPGVDGGIDPHWKVRPVLLDRANR